MQRNSGFDEELKYKNKDSEEQSRNEEKRKKRRSILFFNPPFSLRVKTKIGKLFFKMLRKNFPKANLLQKTLNKNTIKNSYSSIRNTKSIISSHNKFQHLKTDNLSVTAESRTLAH